MAESHGKATGLGINPATARPPAYPPNQRLPTPLNEPDTADATYAYDTDGNRVRETTGGATTYYLIDTNNPTGYPKPIEEKTSPTGSPTVSYILGSSAIAQASGGNVTYFLTDGHGSTRALVNSSGVMTTSFDYDAFGGAIGFDATTAGTTVLFGGDALYDPASGLYFHGSGRQRQGHRFIEEDPLGYGSNSEPRSLHKYLYANANPINGSDPTGHFELGELLTVISGFAQRLAVQTVAASVVGSGTVSTLYWLEGASPLKGAVDGALLGPALLTAYYAKRLPDTVASGLAQGIVTIAANWVTANHAYTAQHAFQDFTQGAVAGMISAGYGYGLKTRIGTPWDKAIPVVITGLTSVIGSAAQLVASGQAGNSDAWRNELASDAVKVVLSAYTSTFNNVDAEAFGKFAGPLASKFLSQLLGLGPSSLIKYLIQPKH